MSRCILYSFTVSPRTIKRVIKMVANGESAKHGNKGIHRACKKTESAIVWMRQYFNLIGDRMPDKNQLHLPSFDRCNVYYDWYILRGMKAQAPEDDSIILGDSMFYKSFQGSCDSKGNFTLYRMAPNFRSKKFS